MSTLTELIKESLEGKLTDQIRTSVEAEDGDINEALNLSEKQKIKKKCLDIIAFYDKYEPRDSSFGSMLGQIGVIVKQLMLKTYYEFADVINALPNGHLFATENGPKGGHTSSDNDKFIRDSLAWIDAVHKAIKGLFGDCIRALPKDAVVEFDANYQESPNYKHMTITIKDDYVSKFFDILKEKGINTDDIIPDKKFATDFHILI